MRFCCGLPIHFFLYASRRAACSAGDTLNELVFLALLDRLDADDWQRMIGGVMVVGSGNSAHRHWNFNRGFQSGQSWPVSQPILGQF